MISDSIADVDLSSAYSVPHNAGKWCESDSCSSLDTNGILVKNIYMKYLEFTI